MASASKLCGKCRRSAATVMCRACALLYCNDCAATRHSRGAFVRHQMEPLLNCEECDERPAVLRCTECELKFCVDCCTEVHSAGAMIDHQRNGSFLSLETATMVGGEAAQTPGYSGPSPVTSIETAMTSAPTPGPGAPAWGGSGPIDSESVKSSDWETALGGLAGYLDAGSSSTDDIPDDRKYQTWGPGWEREHNGPWPGGQPPGTAVAVAAATSSRPRVSAEWPGGHAPSEAASSGPSGAAAAAAMSAKYRTVPSLPNFTLPRQVDPRSTSSYALTTSKLPPRAAIPPEVYATTDAPTPGATYAYPQHAHGVYPPTGAAGYDPHYVVPFPAGQYEAPYPPAVASRYATGPAAAGRGQPPAATSTSTRPQQKLPLDIDRVLDGADRRTTLMIRNIPNKYTQQMLLAEINEQHRGLYDFFYLPIDFKNKCNVGYAFINFIDYRSIVPFYHAFNTQKWRRFNSDKICQLSYGRIQGKESLIQRFQHSALLDKDPDCRPLLFHSSGPHRGEPVEFPGTPATTNGSSATDDRTHLSSGAIMDGLSDDPYASGAFSASD